MGLTLHTRPFSQVSIVTKYIQLYIYKYENVCNFSPENQLEYEKDTLGYTNKLSFPVSSSSPSTPESEPLSHWVTTITWQESHVACLRCQWQRSGEHWLHYIAPCQSIYEPVVFTSSPSSPLLLLENWWLDDRTSECQNYLDWLLDATSLRTALTSFALCDWWRLLTPCNSLRTPN